MWAMQWLSNTQDRWAKKQVIVQKKLLKSWQQQTWPVYKVHTPVTENKQSHISEFNYASLFRQILPFVWHRPRNEDQNNLSPVSQASCKPRRRRSVLWRLSVKMFQSMKRSHTHYK